MDSSLMNNLFNHKIEKMKQVLIYKYGEEEGINILRGLTKHVMANIPLVEIQKFIFSYVEPKTVRRVDSFAENMRPFEFYEEYFTSLVADPKTNLLVKRKNIVFSGTNSTGKTFTGCYLLAKAIENGNKGFYINVKELYRIYNDAHYKDDQEAVDKYQHIVSSNFLVVDELGKENITDSTIGFLEEFIKARNGLNSTTIFITNIRMQQKVQGGRQVSEFKTRYGNSVYSSLIGYHFVEFTKEMNYRNMEGKKEYVDD